MARVFPLDGGALENWAFWGLVPALFRRCTHHCTARWHDGMGCGGVMASRWHQASVHHGPARQGAANPSSALRPAITLGVGGVMIVLKGPRQLFLKTKGLRILDSG